MVAHAAAGAPARAPQVRPAAPRHARPELVVVGPPRPRRRLRTGPTVALGALLAFAIAFAVVACQVVLVQGQQRLDTLDAGITDATDRYQRLRLEVAELESPERIVETATSRLGMVAPPEVTYLTPDGAVTVAEERVPAADPGTVPDDLAEHAATRPMLDGG